MQDGVLSDHAVRAFSSRIIVDGVVRPHVSWRIRRDLSSGLPSQVAGFHGVTQATADVEWSHEAPVSGFATNPWNASTGWVPEPGQRVQIIVRDEHSGNEWTQFSGRVDDGDGHILGSMSSSLIDDYDQLSTEVSHDAMLRIMPPRVDDGANRAVGLVATYYVDYAMRAAGFYCTPRQEPDCALLVPCQGGMWPHRGSVVDAGPWSSSSGGSGHAQNHPAPWGLSVSNFRVDYLPQVGMSGDDPIQISCMIAPEHTGYFEVNAEFGAHTLRLVVNNRTVVAYRNQGTQVEMCRLSPTQMDGATIVSLVVKPGSATLMNDLGYQTSGTSWSSTNALSLIRTAANTDARVAGIQVNKTPGFAEHRPSQGRLTARIGTSTFVHLGTLLAAPAIEKRTAESLLSEISESILSAMWIDEHGVMRWEPSVALRQAPVVDTVTTLDDITSLSWRRSLLGSRSKVTVKTKDPLINQSPLQTVLVYEGGSRSIQRGERIEEILTPATDEAWIGVDTNQTRVGYPNWEEFNYRVGSFMGATYTVDGDEVTSVAGMQLDIGLNKIGPAAWKVTHDMVSLPAGATAHLKTSDTNPRLWAQNRGLGLPRVQAYAKVVFEETEITPVGVNGVGPELVHEAGVWLQDTTVAERVATYLQAETQRARVIITGLRVIYDPRRQLGDRVRIDSPDLMGVTLEAIVDSITNEASPDGGYTQTLGVTVFSASTTFQTYEAFNAAGGRLSYQQWNALQPSRTYAQWDAATGSD